MIYNYTWNHIKILASICECDDTKVTISQNWVNILDDHHKTTFPFTLWPLTYRTSTVMVSSAISTPTFSNTQSIGAMPSDCNIQIKIYKSNEVMVICFQHENNDKDCEKCLPKDQTCVFSKMMEKKSCEKASISQNKEGGNCDQNKDLVKAFKKIKKKSMKHINRVIFEAMRSGSDISCMIFTGYGIGAAMASFMAREMGLIQKAEQEHLGLEKPKISTDCVTFESPSNLANERYWDEIDSIIDKYVDVQHHDKKKLRSCRGLRNQLSMIVEESIRPGSVILVDSLDRYMNDDQIFENVDLRSYVTEIDKKIYMLPDQL